MSHDTLLLNPATWDLVVDANRNIAIAQPPYSQAQSAANAIRLFEGEYYYDTTQGVPYWQEILGHWPPVSLMKARFNAAALTVPFVTSATTFIDSIQDRRPSGQVQVTIDSGAIAAAQF
jgi:hypothetical protein